METSTGTAALRSPLGSRGLRVPRGPGLARLGRLALGSLRAARELTGFALIALGVTISKFNVATRVVRPLVRQQIAQAGLRLLPTVLFVAGAVGLVVVGQTVALLTRVGAHEFIGMVMVTTVIRELGPLATALLVLARAGTACVVELGTARALGEVEALEVLGIDPVHYLVMPRLIGITLAVFGLTIYLVSGALISGYLVAFVQNVPLTPGAYFGQLAGALNSLDFVLFGLKTLGFGLLVAVITCFHGLARPLRLEDVTQATIRAVVQGVVGCVLLDALFIPVYLAG